MTFNHKMLLSHKNPVGLTLRLLTYIAIAIETWHQASLSILVLVGIDILNWFLMPMLHPYQELKIVERVVQIEVDWLKSPWSTAKIFSIISGVGLFFILALGLWFHNWILLSSSFVFISILKITMLKSIKPL